MGPLSGTNLATLAFSVIVWSSQQVGKLLLCNFFEDIVRWNGEKSVRIAYLFFSLGSCRWCSLFRHVSTVCKAARACRLKRLLIMVIYRFFLHHVVFTWCRTLFSYFEEQRSRFCFLHSRSERTDKRNTCSGLHIAVPLITRQGRLLQFKICT